MDEFEARLEYLRDWWDEHGHRIYGSADEWINSMTNVELLVALSWAKNDDQ
jgi:hypothetical protein